MKLNLQQIKTAIQELLEEYKFDPQLTLEIIKLGIKTAFRKDYLKGDRKIPFEVHFDTKGNVIIQRRYKVVEKVEDESIEISLDEAKKYREDINIGEDILIDITPENLEFSRIAVQAAAQTIKQNIKKLERERFYEKFKDKKGQLLKAKVTRVAGDIVILDIEGIGVVLPSTGQIKGKIYNQGEEIYVLLKQIAKDSGGITLDITQADPEVILAALKQNIPEVSEGKVEILKIARIAGVKSKILVHSSDPRIDPVGVFLGIGGERLNHIMRFLGNEKLEFVEYSDDFDTLIKNVFKPVKVLDYKIDKDTLYVKVDESQKALAIGKNAINLKLNTQLLGYKIQFI